MYEKITLKFVDLLLLAVLKLTIVDHLRVVFSAGVLLERVNLRACNHLFDWPCFIWSKSRWWEAQGEGEGGKGIRCLPEKAVKK